MDSEIDITAYIKTESERQQFDTLMRVFEIFRDRSEVRGDLWAEFAPHDAVQNMKSKMARIDRALTGLPGDGKMKLSEDTIIRLKEAIIDDALDLCNYSVFLVRHLEGAKPS